MLHTYGRTLAGIAVVAASVLIVAGCGSGGGGGGGSGSGNDHSSTIAHDIESNGAAQLQSSISSLGGGGSVSVDGANCVQTAGTQTYTCIAHYTYTDASGNTSKYELNISGSCDSGGSCQWHADGNGNLVSQQPAQPAEGSPCTPPGGGKGVIVIEGPSAQNPGHADCVPQ